MSNWPLRFLALAKHISQWSKDPSTQVGAVIVRPDFTIASLGFNGFPRGIADDHRLLDRQLKYEIILHAEENALLTATESLKGFSLFVWPLPPCSRCAAKIIQAGIAEVWSPPGPERWSESCQLAAELFTEAAVRQVEIEL